MAFGNYATEDDVLREALYSLIRQNEDLAAIQAGVADMNASRVRPIREVDAEIRNIEPTNNLAEQAIRFVVIDRRITQGERSETGRRWCERIWTVNATCAQQGRSAFQFVLDSIHAYLAGTASPSLLPSGP